MASQQLPAWAQPGTVDNERLRVTMDGNVFRDSFGREVTLRGVNVGGECKLPFNQSSETHHDSYLKETSNLSFVNRPFSLEDARTHFGRLRACGFNCIRLLYTWEAIEHSGPAKYDTEYLTYMAKLVEIAAEYGLMVYLDPHQDVWSRFSGGSGAPAWTFEVAGLNITKFTATGAAVLHCAHPGDKRNFPKMLWPTNALKFACATMFTLFWGGKKYAPSFVVDKQSGGLPGQGETEHIQDFLQRHYVDAMMELAKAVKHLPNVLGVGTMNEPLPGYIGWPDIRELWEGCTLKNGDMPSALTQMGLASGLSLSVPKYNKIRMRIGSTRMNQENQTIWLPGYSCMWQREGVWSTVDGQPVTQKPHYFRNPNFGSEFFLPFLASFKERLLEHIPGSLTFSEMPPEPLHIATFPRFPDNLNKHVVNAAHWYDGWTLFVGRFVSWTNFDVERGKFVFGEKSIDNMMARQLGELKQLGDNHMHASPTLIGECGIPFNLNGGVAYSNVKEGSPSSYARRFNLPQRQQLVCDTYHIHTQALNNTIKGLEANNLSYTLWNYCSIHTAEYGDGWNLEDLSVFSPALRSEPSHPFSGLRALPALVRPWAPRVCGTVVSSTFDLHKGKFILQFQSAPAKEDPSQSSATLETEIFVPLFHFPNRVYMYLSDGIAAVRESTQFSLTVIVQTTTTTTNHEVVVRREPSSKPHAGPIFHWENGNLNSPSIVPASLKAQK